MINDKFEEIYALSANKKFRELKAYLEKLNEPDIAECLMHLDENDKVVAFRILSKDIAAEVFSYLENDDQELIVRGITDSELAGIIDELFVDDAVDLVGELPADVVDRVLKCTDPAKRKLINQFLKYPENSAGSVMTSEFIRLKKDMTVRDAIEFIRQNGRDKETLYTCYVTDSLQTLLGLVSICDLLTAKNLKLVSEVMDTNVVHAYTDDDVEELAGLVRKYDLITLPVTDRDNKLVGIVTIDDVVDIITDEATEDFEKMAAINPTEKPYMKLSIWEIAKGRIGWLALLMVTSTISGFIIAGYEEAIAAVPLLASFIPMLMDTGGNAGSQSSTVVIRGMALNEIDTKDTLKVLMKEIAVSLLVGTMLAVVNFGWIMLRYPGNINIALTVSLCVIFVVLMAKSLGAVLPMLAKKLKLDPALMAAPLITTAVDMLSLVVYFSLAQKLLSNLL